MKWEYKISLLPMPANYSEGWFPSGSIERIEEALNIVGGKGWELIDRIGEYAIFKRPVKPEPPAWLVVNNVTGTDMEQLIASIKAELDRYWEEQEVRRD